MDFGQSEFDCDFEPLPPSFSSSILGIIVEEVLDNEKNEENEPLESTLFQSCVQWNLSQAFLEESSVFHSPTAASEKEADIEDDVFLCHKNSPIKTSEPECPPAQSYHGKCELNSIEWTVERLKQWKIWFKEIILKLRMKLIPQRIKSPANERNSVGSSEVIEKMILKIKQLEADAEAKQQELTMKINQLQEDAVAMDRNLRRYQEQMIEELRLMKELFSGSVSNKVSVAPPSVPPPPPPLPPPPSMGVPLNPIKKSSVQIKVFETPRPTITAEDLASVRLKKVITPGQKKSYAGQTVTVEQLRSVKLRPRRKPPQAQASPTRTPLCRERVRKIKSPNFRGNIRPRIDRIPLSRILSLNDSFE